MKIFLNLNSYFLSGCEQNLAEYEKEAHLLCSNLEIPSDYEIFASGDVQEIVEPYDEESEKQWRGKIIHVFYYCIYVIVYFF